MTVVSTVDEGPPLGLRAEQCVSVGDVDESLARLGARRQWAEWASGADLSTTYTKLANELLDRRLLLAASCES